MTQTAPPLSKSLYHHLSNFREIFPLRSITIQDVGWTFYDSFSDKSSLLIIPGGGGFAEALFPQISILANEFRVIVPNIPSKIKTVQHVVDGLSTLLNALDIKKTHLFGISLGGHIAQIMIRRHYERVHDVVLSHTAIPCEHLALKTNMQYRMLQMYPAKLLLPMFKRATLKKITESPINLLDDERQFWQTYFDEQYETMITKTDIVSRASIMRDYFQNFTFHSSDLDYWDGRLLIIESSDDDVYEEGDRGALLTMYPRAWIHTFEGYTHLATLLAHKQTSGLVLDFLKGDAYERF